jgi:hypothetical protein
MVDRVVADPSLGLSHPCGVVPRVLILVTAVEAARITVVLTAEALAQEAAAARDSATICIKDAED